MRWLLAPEDPRQLYIVPKLWKEVRIDGCIPSDDQLVGYVQWGHVENRPYYSSTPGFEYFGFPRFNGIHFTVPVCGIPTDATPNFPGPNRHKNHGASAFIPSGDSGGLSEVRREFQKTAGRAYRNSHIYISEVPIIDVLALK